MTIAAWLTLIILLTTFGLLAFSKLPAVVIFLGALTAILTLRIAPESAVLAGFSNVGVLTVGALFMVAAGMYSTGAVTMVADRLIGQPKTVNQAQLKILPPVGLGSAFLNNTPIVAMLIPVVDDLSQSSDLSGSKLYLPVSFASLLGGASTVIGTSTNLIIAGLVTAQLALNASNAPPMHAIGIFEPALVGIPAAAIGIVFMIVVGRWLLPNAKSRTGGAAEQRVARAEFLIYDGSPLAGRSLLTTGLASSSGYRLDSLTTADGMRPALGSVEALRAGDMLAFTVPVSDLPRLWATIGLVPSNGPHLEEADRYQQRLIEMIPAPTSWMIGRLYEDILREEAWEHVQIVAVSRHGQALDMSIREARVGLGDEIIVAADPLFLADSVATDRAPIAAQPETLTEGQPTGVQFLLTKTMHGYRVPRVRRAMVAIVIMIAMVLVASFGWLSMLNAALLATGVMLATGCMGLKTAARSIDFKTLIILASSISLEAAVTSSGLSSHIADLLQRIGGDDAHVALAVVFIGCVILTNIISNAAAAAIIFPIALSMAAELQVDFTPFVIAIMLGTSYSFINPVGSQTNLMVMEPGGYSVADFVKIGAPLTVVLAVFVVGFTPLVFPFH
jgi:di/tricarboxylate transporter